MNEKSADQTDKVTTPICDFVNAYIEGGFSRLHMPGHKGQSFLGPEPLDLTEIKGADALYEADGIIAESEANATRLFGTYRSFYSTEGSSHTIRAMLFLAGHVFGRVDHRFTILAARNVHKAFIHACALLDYDVQWLYAMGENSICSCQVTPKQLAAELEVLRVESRLLPDAVYVTSPDYLGNIADIRGLAEVCARNGLPLLVDNAHGAYLHFLPERKHPMDLGAAMCCDSGHKTLPVLTGGSYLHIADPAGSTLSPAHASMLAGQAKTALSLFGTTSPSYLILQSLDLCNRYLSDGYEERLSETVQRVMRLKEDLAGRLSIPVVDTEPLKLVLCATALGMGGSALAEYLRRYMVECEFADAEYVVLMFTPETKTEDYRRITEAMEHLPASCGCSFAEPAEQGGPDEGNIKRKSNLVQPGLILQSVSIESLRLPVLEKACTIREAVLSRTEIIPTDKALGRICAVPTVSCPPAIPIAVSGERFNEEAIRLLHVYGVEEVAVTADEKCLRTPMH